MTPRGFWVSLIAIVLIALVGCAPATRVTLLPDPMQRPTAVIVTPRIDQKVLAPVVIDKPLVDVDIYRSGQVELVSDSQVLKKHAPLIAIQPQDSERMALNFLMGTSDLTPESAARLPEIIAKAQQRKGGDIVVVGHTDTKGAGSANDELSLKRAQAVRQLLVDRGFNGDLIEAAGRGERELLVPTADEVDEPRNRRVEIIIR